MTKFALGLAFVFSFVSIQYAQVASPTPAEKPERLNDVRKKSETPKVEDQGQVEEARKARQEIAKSVVGSIFLDAISVQEPKWVLNKAGYVERGPLSSFAHTGMLLKNGDNFVGIGISEFDSVEDADAQFSAIRSHGASVPLKGFGDKADKLIGGNGNLMSIRFRKGNFFVEVSAEGDVKRTERFAKHVLKSLGDSGGK